jgi:hypothetical protein
VSIISLKAAILVPRAAVPSFWIEAVSTSIIEKSIMKARSPTSLVFRRIEFKGRIEEFFARANSFFIYAIEQLTTGYMKQKEKQ